MHDWCNGYGNVNLGYGKWVDFAKFWNKHGEALLLKGMPPQIRAITPNPTLDQVTSVMHMKDFHWISPWHLFFVCTCAIIHTRQEIEFLQYAGKSPD